VVDVRDLPDLSEWRKINVRDPKMTGAVPNRIRARFRVKAVLAMRMSGPNRLSASGNL